MRLLCFGDSNTYGYDPRSYAGDRYPPESRWTDLLAESSGWEVVNMGLNGREIPTGTGELAGMVQQDDLLIVMLGDNDLLCHPHITAGEVAVKMERFLRGLPPCRVLLVAPPPMALGEWVTEETLLRESAVLPAAYEALALRLGLVFADAGQWGVEMACDGVYFSEHGHRTFAKGIQEAILCSLD